MTCGERQEGLPSHPPKGPAARTAARPQQQNCSKAHSALAHKQVNFLKEIGVELREENREPKDR